MIDAGFRLIASAAYVDQELSAEFGQIPPAFLPIGVNRLYEAQINSLGPSLPIYMTIPEGYNPPDYDAKRLKELNVTLVPVPVGLRLGESIIYAINYIDCPSGRVEILHGDTLIDKIPLVKKNAIAVHNDGDDYSWALVTASDGVVTQLDVVQAGTDHADNNKVSCGYFVFSSSSDLVRSITRARGDFIGGLNIYIKTNTVDEILVSGWHDFGHIQTYFRSKRDITTARAFNTLDIDGISVHKSSDDTIKIKAEAHWFQNIPVSIQPFAARLLETDDESYRTEYQYAPTLAELFVFSSIGRPTWRKILHSCNDFLNRAANITCKGSSDTLLRELTNEKTRERLDRFQRETGFDIYKSTRFNNRPLPSLQDIAANISSLVNLSGSQPPSVMHGDFCFSNILYNSRSARITVIDPRGYVTPGIPSIFGDCRYDIAKLSHSILGYYDHIIAGRYNLTLTNTHDFSISFERTPHHDWLQHALADLQVGGIKAGSQEIRAITIGLFLSMLPLHADRPDRQTAFIANALRLYTDINKDRP